MREWVNWSGSLRFAPKLFLTPEHEEKLREVITQHYENGSKLKLVAAGHSSSPLVETPDTLVSLHHFKGMVHVDSNISRYLHCVSDVIFLPSFDVFVSLAPHTHPLAVIVRCLANNQQ